MIYIEIGYALIILMAFFFSAIQILKYRKLGRADKAEVLIAVMIGAYLLRESGIRLWEFFK